MRGRKQALCCNRGPLILVFTFRVALLLSFLSGNVIRRHGQSLSYMSPRARLPAL